MITYSNLVLLTFLMVFIKNLLFFKDVYGNYLYLRNFVCCHLIALLTVG